MQQNSGLGICPKGCCKAYQQAVVPVQQVAQAPEAALARFPLLLGLDCSIMSAGCQAKVARQHSEKSAWQAPV